MKHCALLFFAFASAATAEHWIVTWGASPAPQEASVEQMQKHKLVFENQTVREIVHTSAAGKTFRVRLSNAFGKDPVEIGAAHLARRASGSSIAPGSDHALTFNGKPSVTIPPNAIVVSDAVALGLPASADAAISLFIPRHSIAGGVHYSAEQTSYIAQGNVAANEALSDAQTFGAWAFLADLDAVAPASSATVIAFGDSITDGARSTRDANNRWPNLLAKALASRYGASHLGVLDAGIGGNRVLHDPQGNVGFGVSALARFDRDVLAQPSAKYLIVLEGINDLGHPGSSAPASEDVSAEDLIGGLKQLADRAHEHGMKVYGGTLTPFEGTVYPGYFSPEKEARRKAVNRWIRTGGAFDAVIDFEMAVQDPAHPDHISAAYDSGDHLHPNDAGYRKMAQAVDLKLFR